MTGTIRQVAQKALSFYRVKIAERRLARLLKPDPQYLSRRASAKRGWESRRQRG